MDSGVYMFKCYASGKVYVGQGADVYKREADHRYMLRWNKHRNKLLQNAWNKYGEENFVFGVITFCSVRRLNELEQYWMDYYKSYERDYGYNIAKDAGAFARGLCHTEETKKKMSDSHKGMKYKEETKKKIREARARQIAAGKTLGQEARRKISEANKNKKVSTETRVKLQEAGKDRSTSNAALESLFPQSRRTPEVMAKINSLSPKQQEFLKLRFGLDGYDREPLTCIATRLNVSYHTIFKIQKRSLKALLSSSRLEND